MVLIPANPDTDAVVGTETELKQYITAHALPEDGYELRAARYYSAPSTPSDHATTVDEILRTNSGLTDIKLLVLIRRETALGLDAAKAALARAKAKARTNQ